MILDSTWLTFFGPPCSKKYCFRHIPINSIWW